MTTNRPEAVRDADGTIWSRKRNGRYWTKPGFDNATLEDIHEQFGPLTVLTLTEAGEWTPRDPYETLPSKVTRYSPLALRWEQWRRIAGENVYICRHYTDHGELLRKTLAELREDPRQALYTLREIGDDGQLITPDPLPEWVLGLVRAVDQWESIHDKEDRCLKVALNAVPEAIRDAAKGAER